MLITLLTDFGTSDSYVAEVKGVLLALAPGVQLVDIAHDIARGDVRAAAHVLGRAWPRFPEGTVHLAVVDPGVGTARRALAAEAAGHRFVAPDNGLLSSLPADAHFVSLVEHTWDVPPSPSPTFHGRDVFAPVAAAMARGQPLLPLGERVTDPVRLPSTVVRQDGGSATGEVIHVDHFGTLVTNISGDYVKGSMTVLLDGSVIGPVHRTFADVAPGELVAFVGSGGTIEIAARDTSAATLTKLGRGATVRIEPA